MASAQDQDTNSLGQQDARRDHDDSPSLDITYVHHFHGSLNDVGQANNQSTKDDLFTLLNPIRDASHTRDRTVSPPNSKCFAGTRKKVFKTIRAWADSSVLLGNPHIMWVYAFAGCGKSAISQNIAEHYAAQNRLAASFFFFRGSGERSRTAKFAATVASQVASTIQEVAPAIMEAVVANPTLLTTNITPVGAQFEHLVYNPINKVKWDRLAETLRRGPFLIVLDGLDECEDREEIASFISHMIDFFTRKPRTPLRLLITSRVEHHLHERLHSSKQVQLFDLGDKTSDADISTALDVLISDKKCTWPSPGDKAKLVKHIDGSFIFMTTIIKSLFNPNIKDGVAPMERLPRMFAMNPDFDSLYTGILKQVNRLPHCFDIVNTIAFAYEPLSTAQIADLLAIGTADVVNVLVNLHAIMQVPDDDHAPVTLWHTSLRDFLWNETRSGSLFVGPLYHRHLAYACISLSAPRASLTTASDYSRRFALVHWKDFMRSMDGNCSGSNSELGHFIKHLQETFGVDCDRVIGTYFSQPFTADLNPQHILKHTQNWTTSGRLLRPNIDLNLLFPGGNTGPTLLEVTTRAGEWDAVRELMDFNSDSINIQFYGSEEGTIVALHAACYFEVFDMVHFLLEKGADPNVSAAPPQWRSSNDWGYYAYPLTWAASEGDLHLVTRMLACGADPNLQGGAYGSALHGAVCGGNVDVARVLLEHNANPNIKDSIGGTPIHDASRKGRVEITEYLLKFSADPNIANSDGNTPLHEACFYGQAEVVKCLLRYNADPGIKNARGESAFQVARQPDETFRCRTRVREMLRQRGITE